MGDIERTAIKAVEGAQGGKRGDEAEVARALGRGWHYWHLLMAWGAGVLGQSIVLPCLCWEGMVKGYVALLFDVLMLGRMWIARQLRETGRGWVFYAVLCYTSPLWIEGAAWVFMACG